MVLAKTLAMDVAASFGIPLLPLCATAVAGNFVLRQIHMRERNMAAVPKASVVIANPIHLSSR
jgi:hypothetical protein